MTTTSPTATRTRETVLAEIHKVQRAITATEAPLDDDFRAFVIDRKGETGLAQMETANAAHLTEQRVTLAELRAEYDVLTADDCGRCDGTGEYKAPTSYIRNGKAVCFRCGGTGRRKGA